MKKICHSIVALLLCVFMFAAYSTPIWAGEKVQSDKLLVFFTTSDKEVFTKTAFVYALSAKKHGWFEEVRFLIWGPSAKLIAEDSELHAALAQLKEGGVELQSCKWCAEQYGVDGKLAELGVEVKYMGEPLSDMLKSDWKVLTF